MEARSQSAAHQNEMNFIFNLNAFSWKAMQRTRWPLHDAVIRVYDETGNVIDTHKQAGDFKEW